MANMNGFNANDVDPTQDYEAIPPGRYEAIIIESQQKDTASGNGSSYLKLTFQIISGPHKGRMVWHNLNLNNPSEKAVQIARGQLSTICRAVGVMQPKDSLDLHNLPMVVRVDVREFDGNKYNDVKGFYPRTTEEASHPPPSPMKPATAPWMATK